MTQTVGNRLVKIAAIREPGHPVGHPAPCWFTCPCGLTHRAFVADIDCACGQKWTRDGWTR